MPFHGKIGFVTYDVQTHFSEINTYMSMKTRSLVYSDNIALKTILISLYTAIFTVICKLYSEISRTGWTAVNDVTLGTYSGLWG